MQEKKLSEFSDQELLQEAKKMKSAFIINAFLIGLLIGIILYSVVKNSWGFLTLLPLFLIYKLNNKSKNDTKGSENLLKERNLK